MKRSTSFLIIPVLMALCTLVGCSRSSGEVWDDTKSAGRYMGRGMRSLGGKQGESRQVNSRGDFAGNYNEDFIPLQDEAGNKLSMQERDAVPQSRNTPGEAGSNLPGIEAFSDPASDPELASLFHNIQFQLNSELIKGDDNLKNLQKLSAYLKSHPDLYVFIEGHCCELGPQSYNFALGSRRSNSVRNYLVKDGVDMDHLFTISYGKERPLAQGSDEEHLRLNRRAQFKVYKR